MNAASRRSLAPFLVLLAPALVAAQTVALRAEKVVDPEKGVALANQVVLIEAGVIKAIGADVAIPDGAEVIDLSKTTVLPGLFDCHTHLCTNMSHPAGESARSLYEALFVTTLSNTTGYRAITGVANARSMLDAGFTTVRDVGNAGNFADTDLRRSIEEGLVPGPTILNAGRIIAPLGGQFPSRAPGLFRELFGMQGGEYIGVLRPDKADLGVPEYLYADTKDEIRKAVRENILYGARVIKIVVDDQPYIYSADEIRTFVDEAGKAGLKVCAHSMTDAGARNAAEGGVASLEHGFLMSDETIAIMKRGGVVLVGTEFPKVALKELGIPEPMYDRVFDRLKRAYKAGLTMAFGTDIFFQPPGYTRGSLAAAYVDVYKEAGISAKDVLKMMTTNAARLLGVDKQRGALRVGLAADIIATAENPLDDVAALKNVVFVMKDGKVVRR